MKLIITGHGKFASGIESTIKLLAGSIQGLNYIDFEDGMSEVALKQRFEKEIHGEKTVFFCDLIGGTPYKQAAIVQKDRGFADIAVIAGCNIGSLLEVGLQNNLPQMNDVHGVAKLLIEASKNGIQEFGTKKVNLQEKENDGI